MSIPVVCSTCSSKLKAPDQMAGKTLECPNCKANVTVPAAVGPSSLPAPIPSAPVAQIVNVELVPVEPADTRCPFCGEAVWAAARVCKHCGRTIDPALWAAEEALRTAAHAAQARRSDFDFSDRSDFDFSDRGRGDVHQTVVIHQHRQFPHELHLILTLLTCGLWLPVWLLHYILSSRGGGTLLAFLIGIPLCLVMLSCGGCLVLSYIGSTAMNQVVEEADRLYDSGQKAEAVRKYESVYMFVPSARKPEIIKRLVELELAEGNKAEATKWIVKGLNEKLDVPYQTEAAKELHAATKKNRDAALEIAADEKRKRQEEDSAEAKRKAGEEHDASGLVLLKKTVKGTRGNFGGEITGTIVNRRGRKLSYAEITFNLYDRSGAQVGTAIANINGLEPGGSWNFKASSLGTNFETFKFSELSGF